MHIMVDLETMGKRPHAAIVSIGAVKFDNRGIEDDFYASIDLQSAVDGGASMDPETVLWWLQQGEDARSSLIQETQNLKTVLFLFRDWIKFNTRDIGGVWGNGASFDNVILSETYARLGLETPWPFWLDRCYRTIKRLAPEIKIERTGTHHNALDDARSQAEHLIRINNALNGEVLR